MNKFVRALPRWLGFLLAGSSMVLAISARAQTTIVYATEYGQSTNRFGTIDLLNGTFSQISSLGSARINDIGYCPTNGFLYAISNSSRLITLNKTNGTISSSVTLSVGGLQSLAFRPSDGKLFAATQSRLYSLTPSGTATLIGNFGNANNLNNAGQNMRFAHDGNLYISNTSTNTGIYRINTATGAATWVGEATGYPYLILQNGGPYAYAVYFALASGTNGGGPRLVTFDLNSFVTGGTNANGSTHQVTVMMVGAGTNFPTNFSFSGNQTQYITNLTVPVSATGPTNQSANPGNTVVFSTVAGGTAPYSYALALRLNEGVPYVCVPMVLKVMV